MKCYRFITSANCLPRQQSERSLPKLSAWSPHSYLASPPNRLFLRSLSSSSPPRLPSTTTYEELCTALASEDVLVVDVRQVSINLLHHNKLFCSPKSWLLTELSLVQWTSLSAKWLRFSQCPLTSGRPWLAELPLIRTPQLFFPVWQA